MSTALLTAGGAARSKRPRPAAAAGGPLLCARAAVGGSHQHPRRAGQPSAGCGRRRGRAGRRRAGGFVWRRRALKRALQAVVFALPNCALQPAWRGCVALVAFMQVVLSGRCSGNSHRT